MIFLTLFIIPIILILGNMFLFRKYITFKEFLLQMGAQAVIAGISCVVIYSFNTHDVEVHNGKVASKVRDVVSCSHSYSCNCMTVSCGENCTTTICSTCYEHSYDVEWTVYTTNSERIEINTVDRQGVNQPPRWASTQIGEPTSLTYSYTNYVKAAPDTLFRHQGLVEKFAGQLPDYPSSIYDYYRLDRFIQVGITELNSVVWNKDISEINADLGKKKQVNIIVVLVYNKPEEYFYALEQHWIGGKKNDVIVVMSVDNPTIKFSNDPLPGDLIIQWANVMAWTDRQIFKIKLRDDLRELHYLDKDSVIKIIKNNVDSLYVRKHMSDFKYLASGVTPTRGQWIISFIIGLIVCIGLSIFVVNKDVFNEEKHN